MLPNANSTVKDEVLGRAEMGMIEKKKRNALQEG
jgi:hypothetical protein